MQYITFIVHTQQGHALRRSRPLRESLYAPRIFAHLYPIRLNMRDMGRQSVRELDFLFRHPKWKGRQHEILIPAKGVFAGESTARSALAIKLVKMAQEFIAGHRAARISPDDVARHLGCSRQLAELRFSQSCGKTVRRAIEDARMEEAARRLKNGETVRGIVKAMQSASATDADSPACAAKRPPTYAASPSKQRKLHFALLCVA